MFTSQQKPSPRKYFRRQMFGAGLALAGFVAQYPIPAIHRCPVMNPGSAEVAHHEHLNEGDLAKLPPCHRRLAEHATQAEPTREGPHGHESCPVCQGHAQLITHLPVTTTPVVSTLYEFHSSIPQYAEIITGRLSFALPQTRAPPVGA